MTNDNLINKLDYIKVLSLIKKGLMIKKSDKLIKPITYESFISDFMPDSFTESKNGLSKIFTINGITYYGHIEIVLAHSPILNNLINNPHVDSKK